MYLNTYNKNVDIIWQYCIISNIKISKAMVSENDQLSQIFKEKHIEVYDK